MIQGILKQWRTGAWMIYDQKAQRNTYLTLDSIVDVNVKDGWQRITWCPGPGGMFGVYGDERSARENLHARLHEPNDNVRPIRR